MRRHLLIAILAAATLAAGCGDDETDQAADQAQTQVQESAQQAEQAADRLSAEEAVRSTGAIIADVTQSARRLAEDPQADTEQLAAAEQRARDLSERAESDLAAEEPRLGNALSTANDRVADAASELQQAETREEVMRIVEEDLAKATERLRSDAAKAAAGPEARRQLDSARDRVEDLRREIPGLG